MPIPSEYSEGTHGAGTSEARWFFRRSSATTAIRWTEMEASADRRSTRVALRLTPDQLIRQVIQGGGNMPAYGKNLSPAETTALVAFLETLHPAGRPAAVDASQQAALGGKADGSAARSPDDGK